MGHEYSDFFEKKEDGNKSEIKENERIKPIGLGAFNADNRVHTQRERFAQFKKMMEKVRQVQEKKSKNEQTEGFEYEGD